MQRDSGFTGVVLAGGRSRRMGADKALIQLDGKPLVAHAVDALRAAQAHEIFIVGRPPEFAAEFPGAIALPDAHPDEGPLGGLLTAMEHASTTLVVLSPCDLLSANEAATAAVVTALADGDVALPWVDGHGHFVQAGFHLRTYDHLKARFVAGVRSIRVAIEGLDVVELHDGDPRWFHDADTPADLPPNASIDTHS